MDVVKFVSRAFLAVAVNAVAFNASAQEVVPQLSLFGAPPSISKAVDPNLVVTFDNSQSMYWGFLPDSVGSKHALKAAKSAHFNKLYYDPEKTYLPPVNDRGDPLPPANFRAALTNPFNGATIDVLDPASSVSGDDGSMLRLDPARSTVDLSRDYVVRWNVSTNTADIPLPAADLYPLTIDDSAIAPADRGKAYYYTFRDRTPGCAAENPDDAEKDECYDLVIVPPDEEQNFANWYQYYSVRILAAKTVATRTFKYDNIGTRFRVARQTLTTIASGPRAGSVSSPVSSVLPASDDGLQVNRWIINIPMGENSPLRSAMFAAGDFLSGARTNNVFQEQPWDSHNPGRALSCRANFHLVISDGMWNDDADFSVPVNDASSVTLPDRSQYPANSPLYRLDQANTIADIAFQYWSKDLAESLRNNVNPVYRRGTANVGASYWDYLNDPASWQHVTQLVMSFGVTAQVPATAGPLDAMLAGNTYVANDGQNQNGWPAVDVDALDDGNKVDDFYHAAINSRGSFYDMLNPDDIGRSIRSFLSAAGSSDVTYLPVATNSGSLNGEARVFRAEYDGRRRIGDVKAFSVATGEEDSPCTGDIGTVCSTAQWRVNSGGYHGAPNIYTMNPDASGNQKGVSFSAAQFSSTMRDQLRNDGEIDQIVNDRIAYIAGSDVREQARGGPFRNRSPEQRTLGPIVNSSLEYVGNGFNANGSRVMAYPDALEADETYSEFLARISERVPMVYVGSSDGRLHAINARNGQPVFDYVPYALYPQLKSFSRPDYRDDVLVDGQIATGDVYFGGQWHTVLIGGLRTGGKAYYALDITDPTSTDAAPKVLWELTSASEGASELGYTYGKPVIVKSNATASGGSRWVAIFGNGYNSARSDAALIIVDIATGEVLRQISTRSALALPEAEAAMPNGLNTPAAVFADSNFTADYVYAGDLRGNLWKFDLSSSNPQDWKVAYGTATGSPDSAAYDPKPLFVAKDRDGNLQPITAAPVVGGHPQGRDGFMVYFGTGKFLESADLTSTQPQSFYAIWDKDLCASSEGDGACITVPAGASKTHRAVTVSRSQLLAQRVTSEADERREVSNNRIDWATHLGWYMDFPTPADQPAERVIAQPVLRSGMVVYATFIPGVDACEGMGRGWLMAVSRVNGGALDHEPFTNNHGDIENDDYSETPSAGRSVDMQLLEATVLGCGGKSCIVTQENGDMEILDEGMQWGRWRWQELQ